MRKIFTPFEWQEGRHKVSPQPRVGYAWVLCGDGLATEKLDGTNVRLTTRNGHLVRIEKRRHPKKSQKREGILDPWYIDADPNDPANKHIISAVSNTDTSGWPDGEHCCEAVGPKIQGNPLGLEVNVCVPFELRVGKIPIYHDAPRDWHALKEYLRDLESLYSPGHLAEGIVFHHPNGSMSKIRRKDFDYD